MDDPLPDITRTGPIRRRSRRCLALFLILELALWILRFNGLVSRADAYGVGMLILAISAIPMALIKCPNCHRPPFGPTFPPRRLFYLSSGNGLTCDKCGVDLLSLDVDEPAPQQASPLRK
jgi:hypothetical protein